MLGQAGERRSECFTRQRRPFAFECGDLAPKRAGYALALALSVFAAWTFATWFLEGRTETLLRPETTVDRAVYALIANLLIGIIAAIAVLRFLIRSGSLRIAAAGFGPVAPSPLRLAIAAGLGLSFYTLQGVSFDPIVATNVFAQVLVVSAAEVVVCWAVAGATVEALLRPLGRAVSVPLAAAVAGILFGAYHFAHSAPFNTFGMVVLLSVVGLATGAFFFIARDVFATILFHNFLGMFGVVRALAESGQLHAFEAPQPALLIMAVVTVTVLAACDWALLRRGEGGIARIDI